MSLDVDTETVIARPRAEVAAYAADPANTPEWYVNIATAKWVTSPPLKVGSRLAFTARFLGVKLEYTYEIVELVPNERLVMRQTEGASPMETTYEWADAGTGKTRMTLRNRGQARGLARIAEPLQARAMRKANEKDLARLKGILEGTLERARST